MVVHSAGRCEASDQEGTRVASAWCTESWREHPARSDLWAARAARLRCTESLSPARVKRESRIAWLLCCLADLLSDRQSAALHITGRLRVRREEGLTQLAALSKRAKLLHLSMGSQTRSNREGRECQLRPPVLSSAPKCTGSATGMAVPWALGVTRQTLQ